MSLVAVIVAAMALVAPAATATKYVDSFFGNPTSSNPSGESADGGLFNQAPRGVAVRDSTGDVYVVDGGGSSHRIQQFDADNNFVRAWGTDVIGAGTGNNSNGTGFEVCDTQHPTTPNTAADCKAGTSSGTGTGGQLNAPRGIAINQSTGHVYVTEGGRLRVQEFTATGEFVRAWGQDVIVNTGPPPNSNGTGFEICDTQHPTTPNTPADCKAGIAGNTGGAFATGFLGYPSVVPEGAPNAGNVLVADSHNQRVQEFTATGEFVRAFGHDVVQPGGTGEQIGAPVNERQTVVLAADIFGAVTGGTFTLTFDGQTTAPIAYNASGTAVRDALVALSSVGADNVAVTGAGTTATPWTVEFVNALGSVNVSPLTGNGAGLTTEFGFAGLVNIATATPGGPGAAFETCTVITECKAGTVGAALGQFAAGTPSRAVADLDGAVYTIESTSALTAPLFRVQKFSPQAAPPNFSLSLFASEHLGQTGPLALTDSSSATDLAFDRVARRVVVARGYLQSTPTHQPFFSGCQDLASNADRRILEFSPGGELKDMHLSCAGFGSSSLGNGIAVRSSTGDLYMSSSSNGGSRVWKVDADGITPAVGSVGAPTDVSATSAQLAGLIDPNSADNNFSPTGWKLQVSRTGSDWRTLGSGSVGNGSFPDPNAPYEVSGVADGLLPNTLYRARLVTSKPLANPEVSSPEVAFATDLVPPEVRTTSSRDVGATTATISARVNPHSAPTSYRFEWGEGGLSNSVPIPGGSVGSGPEFVYVAQQLQGLSPGTTYHYRAVALSPVTGTTVGPTRTFTTAGTDAGVGSAGRGLELVSPPDKVGGQGVGDWYTGPESHAYAGIAAVEGDRYSPGASFGGTLVDGAYSYANDWALAEHTPAGWVRSAALNRAGGQGEAELFRGVLVSSASDDFELMAWTSNNKGIRIFPEQEDVFGTVPIAKGDALREWSTGKWEIIGPLAPEQNSTAQDDQTVIGSVVAPDGGYALTYGMLRGVAGPGDPTHPSWPDLVCSQPAPVNVCSRSVYIDDVTAGLSDTFPGAGVRSLVNVCTGSGADRTRIPAIDGSSRIGAEACPDVVPSGPSERLISPRGASIDRNKAGVISADGSRVFFTSPDIDNTAACTGSGAAGTACPAQLFVRHRDSNGAVRTRWISRSRSVASGDGAYGGELIPDQQASLMAPVSFEGASRDGDKVYFRTASPLTPDDPNGGAPVSGGVVNGPANALSTDLYMYDFPDAPGADPGDGTLTRISAGPTGEGDPNVSTGGATALRFAAPNGDPRAYFVTAAPLAEVPAAESGTNTTPGGTTGGVAQRNLYVYDATVAPELRWRFIARLPASTAFGGCATTGGNSARGDAMAPDPQPGAAVIASANCVRGTADGQFLTFMTDGRLTADDPDSTSGDVYAYDAERDDLTRISAAQGGIGGSYTCVTAQSAEGTQCNGDTGINSSFVPAMAGVVPEPEAAADRIAFFQSKSRLLPSDHNDAYDVYQWRDGELSLISTGAAGAEDALYRGNDKVARNVYVSSRDRLTWEDHDSVLDVYSARVGGGIPQPALPVVCDLFAAQCQGGGVGSVSTDTRTRSSAGGGNAAVETRKFLSLRRPSASQRRRAARSGVLSLRIRSSEAGRVSAVARGRVGKKMRRVGRASETLAKPGVTTVRIKLNRVAVKQLRRGRKLNLSVRVRSAGARPRSVKVALRRAGR